MTVPSVPLGNPTKIVKGTVVSDHPGRLIAAQLNGGTSAYTLSFYNNVSEAAGDVLYSIVAPCTTGGSDEASTVFEELPDEGIEFSIGCFCALTEDDAVGWVWFR